LRGACLEAEGCSESPCSSERTRTRWSLSEESPLPSTSSSQPQISASTTAVSEQDQEGHQAPSIGRGSSEEIIESLKAKIREQKDELEKRNQYKCLICMETYQTPLASIQCWHVHCEECWLRTLGAKKLCPQCNMITSPSDLRKIYL
jgi:hypothetical protein